jgi:mRNA-degrading endonuclease toxin of MazEF toxin-antitoxin module
LTSGDVLLCDLNPVAGRERGVRPVVVVSHPRYAAVPGLFIAV